MFQHKRIRHIAACAVCVMEVRRMATQRDKDERFTLGQSGNPTGRKKASRDDTR